MTPADRPGDVADATMPSPSAAAGPPTAPVVAAALVAGFAVAEASGARGMGGLVLLVAAGWCARRWWRTGGPRRCVGLLVVMVGAAVLAHPLAGGLGAWSAVVTVAAVAGGVVHAVADRRHPRTAATARR